MRHCLPALTAASLLALAAACSVKTTDKEPGPATTAAGTETTKRERLEDVATSTRQWAGLAIAHDGTMFVGFPRWSADVPVSVGRLAADGSVAPFPDAAWNAWQPGAEPINAWVCAQGMSVDRAGSLWVVDPASPGFAGVVEGGAKLVELDPRSAGVKRVIRFDASAAPTASYLNDVRVDLATNTAYLTDSGRGAIVVVDLASGTARRLLDGHASTASEGIALTFGGQEFRLPDGSLPQVCADGIALDPAGTWLYWHALTGRTLWRIETAALRDAALSPEALAAKVEKVADTPPCDGMEFGFDGRLYLTGLEDGAILRLAQDGKVETVVQDARLQWPDTLAFRSDGWLYVSTSQIHRGFGSAPDPYRVMRLRP